MVLILFYDCAYEHIYSSKVQQRKVVEDQVYGIPSPINIQVTNFLLLILMHLQTDQRIGKGRELIAFRVQPFLVNQDKKNIYDLHLLIMNYY